MNCQLRNIFPVALFEPNYFGSEELHKRANYNHNWLCLVPYIWNVLEILNAVKGLEDSTKRKT